MARSSGARLRDDSGAARAAETRQPRALSSVAEGLLQPRLLLGGERRLGGAGARGRGGG